MNRRTMLVAAAAAAVALISAAAPVEAREIPYQTPAQLKSTCQAAGGSYQAPNVNGVYTCMFPGTGIVSCGGVGGNAKTCQNNGARTIAGTIRVRPGASWSTGTYQAQPGLAPWPTGVFQAQ
jgi:hypothetical protein